MIRLLTRARVGESRADLRAQLDRATSDLRAARAANTVITQQLGAAREDLATVRRDNATILERLGRAYDDLDLARSGDLPPSIAALVSFYVRDPLAAVDALPSRDRVRAERAAWCKPSNTAAGPPGT